MRARPNPPALVLPCFFHRWFPWQKEGCALSWGFTWVEGDRLQSQVQAALLVTCSHRTQLTGGARNACELTTGKQNSKVAAEMHWQGTGRVLQQR